MTPKLDAVTMRILRAIATTPYGALVTHKVGMSGERATLEEIADYLEAMRDVLKGISEEAQRAQERAARIDRAIDGAAALMNIIEARR